MSLTPPNSTLQLLHSLTVRLVCYRRVFDPFKIQLRISQSAGTGPVPVTSPDASPAKTNAKTNVNINPAAVAQSECEAGVSQACL